MDKHQIGVNAGKVWKLLNDNKRWSYCDLKRASELSDRDLNAAIGWLARENKIGTFIKYYKISQLIHTQSIAN